jgi:HK97 family phage prohead protease
MEVATMAINLKDREYRSFAEFRLAESDEGGSWVEGYAAVFESPTVLYEFDGVQYKETIERSAFEASDMRDVILNYNHEGKVVARTRNKTLQLAVDDRGLFVRARLDGTEEGRRMFEEIQGGYLDKMSFAFSIAEEEFDKQSRTRSIKKIQRLYDVSVVSLPAYDDTSISARSFFSAVAEEERKALESAAMLELEKEKFQFITQRLKGV